MSIEFHCKGCSKRLRCPDSAAGTKARCPQCNEINNIPLVSDPPSPSPAANSDSFALSPPVSLPTKGEAFPPAFGSPPPSPQTPPPPASPIAPPPFAPTPFSHAPFSSAKPEMEWGSGSQLGAPAASYGNQFADKTESNPYSSPQNSGGMPSQPTDQSGLASSLGVVSIIGGGVCLTIGFCCCPVAVFGSVLSLGLGIWGWVLASSQLKQIHFQPHLRQLENSAKVARTLCLIGVILSSLATLLYGSLLLISFINGMMN